MIASFKFELNFLCISCTRNTLNTRNPDLPSYLLLYIILLIIIFLLLIYLLFIKVI
jgi:uncharacterized protein (DUF983 family)